MKNLCQNCYNTVCPVKTSPEMVVWAEDYQIHVSHCNYFENIAVKQAKEASLGLGSQQV